MRDPDSALLPALVAAQQALAPFAGIAKAYDGRVYAKPSQSVGVRLGDLRRAREAHALIQAALQQHNGEKV